MAKLGDTGLEVTEIQKLLSMLGYDLVIDGQFGAKTVRSLQAFQKKMCLVVDGEAGPKTLEALKAAQKRTAKEDKNTINEKDYSGLSINKSVQLDSTQYLKQNTPKDKIFIHFTAGGPNAKNVINGWASDEPRVSTAFIIDRDLAEAYECFNPDFWSFHLGIKGTNGSLDKASIGIEVCLYGPLVKKGEKFYAWPANWTTEIHADQVATLEKPFRGYTYFHEITNAQLLTLEKLLEFLIDEYNIPVQKSFDMSWFDFKQDLIDNKTPGVWTHVNVRKDKSDFYPSVKLLELLNRLSAKYNNG